MEVLPVIALMYCSKKFCEMLVPFTVATAGELSDGVLRLESDLGWQDASPASAASRMIRE